MLKVSIFSLFVKSFHFGIERKFLWQHPDRLNMSQLLGSVSKFNQTNPPGSKSNPDVQHADALTHFGQNISSHAERAQFVFSHAVAVAKKAQKKALTWNFSRFFFQSTIKVVVGKMINDLGFIKKNMEPQQHGDKLWSTLEGFWIQWLSWTLILNFPLIPLLWSKNTRPQTL